jgi:hypothetical protein
MVSEFWCNTGPVMIASTAAKRLPHKDFSVGAAGASIPATAMLARPLTVCNFVWTEADIAVGSI